MGQQQNATNGISKTDENNPPVPYSQLSYIQRAYIDWKSLNGLITDDDGIRKMSLTELAEQLQVERSTIYRAVEKIPNLWELIDERLKEISGRGRLAKVRETWYLKAAKGDFQHMQLWLANYDKQFKMPTEKHQMDVSDNLADVMNLARERRLQAENVIDGETVDNATEQQN